MGNSVDFFRMVGKKTSRRSSSSLSEFVSVGSAVVINGYRCKIVRRRGDSEEHTSLPLFSATSDVYLRKNRKGVCQARFYFGHKVTLDFDWSHTHTNKRGDGQTFRAGVVHVQLWVEGEGGLPKRLSENARHMSDNEIMTYGPILKHFAPWVKFR